MAKDPGDQVLDPSAQPAKPGQVDLGEVVLRIEAPPRVDGYRPIADSMWTFAAMTGGPLPDAARYLLSLARRLDAAQRCFERVRKRLEAVRGTSSWSPATRATAWEAIGEAEVAMVVLTRALVMGKETHERLGVTNEQFPRRVSRKIPTLRAMRNDFEHIEDRAFGLLRNQRPDPAATALFDGFPDLFTRRRIRVGRKTLGVDDEATVLITLTRDYVVRVWVRMIQRRQRLGL